jgi:hypothetical protein
MRSFGGRTISKGTDRSVMPGERLQTRATPAALIALAVLSVFFGAALAVGLIIH